MAAPIPSQASISKVQLDARPCTRVSFTQLCAQSSRLATRRPIRLLSAQSPSVLSGSNKV